MDWKMQHMKTIKKKNVSFPHLRHGVEIDVGKNDDDKEWKSHFEEGQESDPADESTAEKHP